MSQPFAISPAPPRATHACASLALLSLLMACQSRAPSGVPRTQDRGPILAKVGAETSTTTDLEAIVRRQSPVAKAIYGTREKRRALLDAEVATLSLAQEASRRGYDQDPEVIRARRQQTASLLIRREVDTKVKPETISQGEIVAYFIEAHKAEFSRPEEVRVSEVLIKDQARAEKVAVDAHNARKPDPAADQRAFHDIVANQSEDADSKQRGGDLGMLRSGVPKYPPELVEAALSLKVVGDVSAPVKTARGFHILKLIERRSAVSRDVADVSNEIRQKLFRELRTRRMDELVEAARRNNKIEIMDDRLNDLSFELPPPNPAGSP